MRRSTCPGRMGNSGRVRSNAWIWDFSKPRTGPTARSGGFRFSRGTSLHSRDEGSPDSLKVSVRCGCNPKARQMRLTVLWLSPTALGHGPGASMGRVPGRGLQRQRNHTLHVVIGNRSRPSAARFVRQSVQPPPGTGNAISPPSRTLPGGAHRGGCGLRHSPKSFWPAAPKLAPFSDDEPTVPRFHARRHPKLAAALVVRLPWSSSSGLLTRRIPHSEYYYNDFSYTTLATAEGH